MRSLQDVAPQRESVADLVSLCSLQAGERQFGIDTRRIREVLGKKALQRVPLAPAFIAGVVPYRGEVLTTVSFRALLGMEPATGESCVLVLGGEQTDGENVERFGLVVDGVGGVVTLEARTFTANPSTLDEASKALFLGAYRLSGGLLVQLDPDRLTPARLAATGLFEHVSVQRRSGQARVLGQEKETECER